MPPLFVLLTSTLFRRLSANVLLRAERNGRKMAGRILLIQIEYINALITQTMLNYSGAGMILWDLLSSWFLLLSNEHTFIKQCSVPRTLGSWSLEREEKEGSETVALAETIRYTWKRAKELDSYSYFLWPVIFQWGFIVSHQCYQRAFKRVGV